MYKIAIVEDDKEIREELAILLKNAGYQINQINNFENVEQQILENEYDLILLDKENIKNI